MRADWILLAVTLALAVGAIWCAVGARGYARQAEYHVRRAQAADKRAWGAVAEMQLSNLKRAAVLQQMASRAAGNHTKEQ